MMFSTNLRRTLFLAAVLAIGAVCVSGCSGKKNPASPSGGSLVCQDGEAWIKENEEVGYIFTAEGDMIAVEVSGGRWNGRKVGTYSTSGDKLTLVFSGETVTATYKISGGKLTLTGGGETLAFVKRTGVNVDV